MHSGRAEDDLAERLFRLADESNGRNVEIDFGGRSFLVVQDPADAERILRLRTERYEKALGWLSQVIGPSRLTENGEAWQSRQRLSQHHLSKCDPARIFALSRHHGRLGADLLLAEAARKSPRLDDGLFRIITSGILMEALFDRSWASLGFSDFSEIAAMLDYAVDYSFFSARHRLDAAARVPIDPGRTRAFLALRHQALQRLSSIRRTMTPADPMLSDFLRHEETDKTFKLEHELLMFLAAGSETSAAAIGWGIYLLAREPELQEALRARLRDVWRSDGATLAGLQRDEEFSRFVTETMRIFPPTPVLIFRALAEDPLSDRVVAPGDLVLISIIGINHARDRWPDPWRMHLQADPAQGRAPKLTFSTGPRVCGGRHFATAEVMTVLAAILNEVRLELTSPEAPSFRWCLSLNPRHGHPVRAARL